MRRRTNVGTYYKMCRLIEACRPTIITIVHRYPDKNVAAELPTVSSKPEQDSRLSKVSALARHEKLYDNRSE
jgi:hypothetical protein